MDFYSQLNYSLGNEDWQVEKQALRVSPGDSVACVTASGDRPLHLLMTDCAKIVSLDMNRIQNYLLDLKLAAITQLDYEKYLAFLGCTPTPHRYEIFKQLKPHLADPTINYWQQHKKLITKGIIYQGKVERLTKLSGLFLNLVRHKKIKTLLSFTNLAQQQEFVAKHWDTFLWKKMFEILINPNVSKLVLLRDPGLNSFTDYSTQPGKYIYQQMITCLNNHLAQKSALLQLVLTGKIQPEAYFPYLTLDGYHKIRRNVDRLQYQTGNIVDFLNRQEATQFDCFSMSDIASYMPQEVFEQLLTGIYASAKPGARFCLREFMSKRHIPNDLKLKFQRDPILEQKLEKEEVNFVYRFMVGEVVK